MRRWSNVRAAILILPALVLGAASSRAETKSAEGTPASGTSGKGTPGEEKIEPQAKDALTRMSDLLKSLPVFSLHEDITREQVINNDLKVEKHSTADTTVRRPDHMKTVVVADDDKSHSLFFDGKTFTVLMPGQNYYAQMDAPGPIGTALDTAQARYGVELPAQDFLQMATGDEFTKDLSAAGFVGKSRVGGAAADHYAYRTADVDYQLWLASGDKPLPLKLVITSKKMPTQPEYTTVMTWDLAPRIDDGSFAFTPPEGATKIPFGVPAAAQGKKAPAQPQHQK
jgi:hypothetical protein